MSEQTGERARRLAVIQARLHRIVAGDLSAAVEPKALTEARQLAELLWDNDEDPLEASYSLGWLHWFRYQVLPEGEDQADLEATVEWLAPCFLAGVDALPEPLLPLFADAIEPVATRLLQQAFISTELTVISAAVELWQRILHATPADHPDRAGYLSNLGAALQVRFGRTGDQADLDEAIRLGREASQATPADHPDRAGYLSNLSLALRERFERTGDQTDLDEAIRLGREATQATPADHPDRAAMLSNLAGALQVRFGRTGDQTDLDEAIRVGQEAVEATPAGHPDRATMLSNLGAALRKRFGRTGDQTDLDEAIRLGREATQATPADHPDRAAMLSNLGLALRERFGRTGDQTDLDEAIRVGQEATQATPADHPDRAGRLSNLGAALRERFGRTGDQTDLDEAIRLDREATQATPAGHPDRAGYLSNLGAALRERFGRTGDQTDLDEAIRLGREAVGATPAGHPDRAGRLSNLAGALQVRFWRTGDQADLDEAIRLGREATQATPAGHPDRAAMLSNLAGALHMRFGRTGDQTDLDEVDLDEAIRVGREATQATPADHPDRATMLSNLGLALRERFGRTGDQTDLDEAIRLGREATQATPADHPDRAAMLSNLGAALRERFGRTGDQTDLDEAVSAYVGAWESGSAAPSVRMRAAGAAARLLAQSEDGRVRAADVLEAAVWLLPEVAPRQLARGDQQYALGGFAGLAGDAAALVLANPRGTEQDCAARALRLLEAGRAVLLSQVLDTRSDLTDLHEQHPELAARFVVLRDRLDQPETSALTVVPADAPGTPLGGQDRLVQDRHRLARDFAATLAEVRTHDAFASFGLPPTTEELLAQAGQGSVVVFNISGYRSDALLLTETGITAVPLPGLGYDALIDRINIFRQALHTASAGASGALRREAQAILSRTLEWLWDVVTGPVLTALGHHRQPSPGAAWPQVWWAPGGLLGLLPVHAAGYHTDPADAPERRTVLDRVISSYTPTVRALRYTRQRTPALPSPARALIVAMPTTPHLPDRGRLNYVPAEVEKLHQHLTDPVLLREPDPDRDPASLSASLPTKASVLAHLPTCPIAHFACHGASHPADPSKSLLLLHDHDADPLTVASLAPVRLDQAQLAYLSACRTAAIDAAELLDEAIHLTSAFQLAGFPHVVGTLWEIDDQIAVTVADAFYTHLTTDEGTLDASRAAHALHHAIRAVRDGHDLPGDLNRTRTPSLWAAHLHAGA
ncbi:CHAT domain-containing tetratricopeptide repeat protein [Streptomyces sp. HUAS TT20]|uniref:CHAT domain-containing tetratricopeptide repeat protein n=1 Tax=Streptomyces sp. HUAS TT20 TaxID=3447509 RepID=UPI0021DA501F|nr:CHAT domain-containing protein [Streptomyces sp. HUAS 15-9]UXY25984.1 CHAT domain-containing protein [Streptomyces sp. HUAS 15-9]